ncbi:MAG: lipoyl(octanoyl) transferase LipB [Xanthobacteraceae bacterium]|nr:lipoyl(octanoyl) transferase LipB [Xanthobacteraceae bacterium]
MASVLVQSPPTARARDGLAIGLPPAPGSAPVEWRIAPGQVPYPTALAAMQARTAAVAQGEAPELAWLLEHPPLYTAGTGARDQQPLDPRFPLHRVGRGGQLTYHGPGQRVLYAVLDLKRRAPDVRRYVASLEELIIRTLGAFNVRGERRADRIGVWVARPDKGEGYEDKIAAIGIRISRWVTMHGLALNVEPNLAHFAGIVPCGVSDRRFGVTSLVDLGLPVTMSDVDLVLRREFEALFGPTAA